MSFNQWSGDKQCQQNVCCANNHREMHNALEIAVTQLSCNTVKDTISDTYPKPILCHEPSELIAKLMKSHNGRSGAGGSNLDENL